MPKVRAKFKCDSVMEYPGQKNVTLSVVTTGSDENKSFSRFTPNGSVNITIDKDAIAANLFSPGKEYYLDFTECETETE